MLYTIQLMTFDEVNTRIDQPMEYDIHLGIRGEYLLLLHSINASLFPEYCRIENYIHVVRSATFYLQLTKLSRNVQLKTKRWKLWKAGVCLAMTEDVNGA